MIGFNSMQVRHQSGFTMVELLIAGLLGLFLIAGVLQIFQSSNQNYKMQDDLAVIQEDGRLAQMFLEDQIQQTGWNESGGEVIPADPLNIYALVPTSDGTTDSLSITYWPYTDRDTGITYDKDCNGAAVAAGAPITNRFYVDTSKNQLMCLGSASTVAQPLIGGVEDFQLQYGVDRYDNLGCPSSRVTSYMTASQLKTLAATVGAAQNLVMPMSVKMAILLVSDDDILSEGVARYHQLLDKKVSIEATDKKLRRVFQSTIYMPNSAYSAQITSQANGCY